MSQWSDIAKVAAICQARPDELTRTQFKAGRQLLLEAAVRHRPHSELRLSLAKTFHGAEATMFHLGVFDTPPAKLANAATVMHRERRADQWARVHLGWPPPCGLSGSGQPHAASGDGIRSGGHLAGVRLLPRRSRPRGCPRRRRAPRSHRGVQDPPGDPTGAPARPQREVGAQLTLYRPSSRCPQRRLRSPCRVGRARRAILRADLRWRLPDP